MHLLVYELYRYQNALYNDKKNTEVWLGYPKYELLILTTMLQHSVQISKILA